MSIKRSAALLCVATILITPLLLANQWQLRKSRKGIKIYTRKVNGSATEEFRGIMEVQASLSSILALLNDFESYPLWFPNIKEIKLLKRISMLEMYIYQAVDLPWPVKDRDSVYKVMVKQDPATGIVLLSIINMPDYLPERTGMVRVRNLRGFWKLVPGKNSGKVTIIMQQYSEPGGRLPAWVANFAVVKRPFRILEEARKLINGDKYRNAHFKEIKEWPM